MINNKKHIEKPPEIQLELPDYSYAYEEWKRKQEKQNIAETVIIIENN